MKAYITKFALTEGIFIAEGEISKETPTMFVAGGKMQDYFHFPDWHTDWESAKKQAESMRQRAIKAAERRIDRLKVMKFVEPPP